MDFVIWIEMNKIIFSVVILVPVLGSTAFVAPVLAEKTKDWQKQATKVTTVEDAAVVFDEEKVVKMPFKKLMAIHMFLI